MKLRHLLLGRKAMTNLDSKSRDIILLTKVCIVKALVFPVVMYGCGSWTIRKAEHQRIDVFKLVLEKTLESPLDSKEIKSVNPEENQSWICIGKTEAEAPILWQPDLKSRLIRKDSDAGKDWRQEEKGMIDDEMVGWHCWLNGYEFEQTPRDSEGQGSLAYCSPWGCKELDTAEQLNNNYWRWNHYLVSSPTLPIQNFLTFSGFSDFTLPFPSFNTVFYFALYFWSIESFISDPSKKNRWLIFKNSKLPGGFGEKFLGKIWGEDCRVGDFLLTGEEVAG